MKLCVIGNSHIASLKVAWDKELHRQYPEIQPVFFGARGGMLFFLRTSRRKLLSIDEDLSKSLRFTSGGDGEIDPKLFDAFLIYGVDSDVQDMLGLENGAFSEAVQQATFEEFWQGRPALKLALKLRSITDKPIYVGLQPLPSSNAIPDLPANAYGGFCAKSAELVFQPLALTLVGQPGHTLADGGCTNAAFANGSDLLQANPEMAGAKHDAADTIHMNADFGAIWLREFIAAYF